MAAETMRGVCSVFTGVILMKYGGFLVVAGGVVLAGASGATAHDAALVDSLRANHAAMVASEQDFHRLQQRGSLDASEASDYAAYVAQLHRLVAEGCAAVMEAGLSPPPQLGCPERPPVFLAPAAIDQVREQTIDEQIAVLDAELLGGLGDFDEMLLREQERVRAETPASDAADAAQGEGASAGGGAAQAGSAGDTGQSDSGAGAQKPDGGEASATRGQGMGPGASGRGGRQGAPPGIPDGSDDDVVARQLREAAEKETSPALKEKLWEEYRKYKEGTR
ncbi:MAG: hypothetical protein WBM59_02295 [Sedimenticolaceae bacterium]